MQYSNQYKIHNRTFYKNSPTLSFYKRINNKKYVQTPSSPTFLRRGNNVERLYAEEHAGVGGGTQKINTVLVNAQDVTTAAVIFA